MKRRPTRAEPRLGSGKRSPEQQAAHREVMRVFTGLLLALFVAMLSGTIVGNALPVIIAELNGTQLQYTWIVSASLLASTAATPIFGKLADLFDKKKLLLFAIGLFGLGSLLAGMSTSASALIAFRVIQGIGMGSQMALVQTTIATIIPPRERGRYNGYMGAVMAVATVSGPLIGGVIVDTPWLGWRWCYWSAIPFTIIAMVVLQRRLVVPPATRRHPKIDYWGSALIVSSVTLLLLWLSFAGTSFAWGSWQTAAMLGAAVVGIIVFVLVELRVPEPVVPMWILTERTTALSIIASFAVGTIMFGAPVFLGQYFQIGRGYGPAAAGMLITPMMIGVFLASTIAGRLVTRRGTWKRYVVGGISIQAAGVLLMATVGVATPLWIVGAFLFLVGIGQGASMQNLVLAVQNTVRLENMGVASSTVAFFRTLGGAVGVQVLGAILATHVNGLISSRLAAADVSAPEGGAGGAASLDLDELPGPVEDIVRGAYGDGMAIVFAVMALLGLVALVATLLMRNSLLRSTIDVEDVVDQTDAQLASAQQSSTEPAARNQEVVERPATDPTAPEQGAVDQEVADQAITDRPSSDPATIERKAGGQAGDEPGQRPQR